MLIRSVALAAMLLSGACAVDPVESSQADLDGTALQACQDLVAAQKAMATRCGHTKANGYALQYVDCSTVKAVADMAALYDECIPLLEQACYLDGPAPCHQLQF
jgi:hypothetical protein